VNGEPYIVYGVSIPADGVQYFEFVSALEYERTLSVLAVVLLSAGSVTTLGGALAGWAISRRLLRPLATVAKSAMLISEGEFSHRLDVGDDPDLQTVATSFNDMAASLEARIARERRFSADVSHELRTPLTAMGSAVNLAKRSEMSERASYAIELLDQQLHQFRRLTLELLEISRIDAGVATLDVEPVDVLGVVNMVLDQAGVDRGVVESTLNPDDRFRMDGTRFERIVVNLIENADRYGNGVTRISVEIDRHELVLVVDDDGPGVPEQDRVAIFGRFNRGSSSQPDGKPKGTGLGLSLVDEHVRMHGGSIVVADSATGGARFIVSMREAS
jgi:two-component system sensor histidine kinase MtrB